VRVRVVVPGGFDNPGRPTGGNTYDQRVCAGLAEAGWDVLVTTVRQRRSTLHGWEQTTQKIANALTAHGHSKPVPPGMNNHPGESAR
jgi:hypothetical protein